MMSGEPAVGSAQRTVRRLITYLLLFALVVIAAVGLSGLLERILVAGTELATADVAGLARSLAFALVGGSLAASSGGSSGGGSARRRSAPRSAGASTLPACTCFPDSGGEHPFQHADAQIGGESLQWRPSLATGLVWAGVWVVAPVDVAAPGQRARAPQRRAHRGRVTFIGLILGAGGAVAALGGLFDAALQVFAVARPWAGPGGFPLSSRLSGRQAEALSGGGTGSAAGAGSCCRGWPTCPRRRFRRARRLHSRPFGCGHGPVRAAPAGVRQDRIP